MAASDLETLRADLQAASLEDAAAFRELIERSITLLQLVDTDLSREFGVSRPTITRWRNGTTAPLPALRRPVYAWIVKRMSTLKAGVSL